MKRGLLAGSVIACSLSAVLCAWAYRLDLDRSALSYDFAFDKPQKGEPSAAVDGGAELTNTIQFQLRPLFSASRRPVQIGGPEPQAVSDEAEPVSPMRAAPSARLKLLGTEHGGEGGAALIVNEDTGTSNWIGAGDSIDGWRVLEIRADTVLLVREEPTMEGGPSLSLTLYPEEGGP